ncbi:hypothetical protein [Rhodococcus sp. B10]|nr:hypothetical protein [Rhodococcus sp. B10]
MLAEARALLADDTVIPYVLIDQYLRAFEMSGATEISIAHIRSMIENLRR